MEQIDQHEKDSFLTRYRHWIAPVAIFGGFIADIFTLNQIDQIFDNAILVAHLLISGFAIAMLFTRNSAFGKKINIREKAGILEALMLFSFGGLFSGFAIFYTRSGSLAASWPFVVAMLLLMVGTELYKKFYKRLTFQIVLYFIAVTAYMTILVPLVTNKMGPWIFILSGAVAVGVMYLYMRTLKWVNERQYEKYAQKVILFAGMFFVLFNVAYFTNILPPIPLSVKFKAVYHSVEKTETLNYNVSYERNAWYNLLRKRSRVFHRQGGEPVYVFASVFAPVKFETDIVHRWEYYNTDKLDWEVRSEIPLTIQGGRKGGYRGYTYKESIEDGRWRVAVSTQRGQVIGYIYFRVVSTSIPPELTFETI
jgi:hypothetical protein